MTNSPDQNHQKKPPARISVGLLRNTIGHHPVLFLGLILATGLTAAGVWFFLPMPKYTAIVVFHIAGQNQRGVDPLGGVQVDVNAFRQYQAIAIKKRQVLQNALKDPEVQNNFLLKREKDEYAWLDLNLKVDKPGSEFLKLSLEGDQPEEMLAIVKAVTKAYQQDLNSRETASLLEHQTYVDTACEKLSTQIKVKQSEIESYALELGSSDPVTLAIIENGQNDNLRAAQKELLDVNNEIALLAQEQKFAAAQQPKQFTPEAVEESVRRDPTFVAAEAAVTAAKQFVAEVEAKLTPGTVTPAITKAKDELKAAEEARERIKKDVRSKTESVAKEKIAAERNQSIGLLNERYNQLTRKKDVCDRQCVEIKANIEAKAAKRIALERARKEIASQEKMLSALDEDRKRLQLQKETQTKNRVSVHDDPYFISGVEGFRRAKFSAGAAAGLFLVGFGALVWWENRSRRITSSDEIAQTLGLPVLGTLPVLAKSQPHGEQDLIESIDSTRTLLLHSCGPNDKPLRTLVVTSGAPGEGKTTLSGHLSISLARAGFTVLLVDGDVHRPSAHRLFDVPAGPGLCEVLREEATPNQVIRSTPVPGLCVMPAGEWSLVTRQALVGERWGNVRRQLERQFDFVVVDTAPFLLMTDSQLLAKGADGVLISTLLGTSRVGSVALTQHRLASLGARVLGLVVNGVRPSNQDRYRYQYYSKGYATAGGSPAKNSPPDTERGL